MKNPKEIFKNKIKEKKNKNFTFDEKGLINLLIDDKNFRQMANEKQYKMRTLNVFQKIKINIKVTLTTIFWLPYIFGQYFKSRKNK